MTTTTNRFVTRLLAANVFCGLFLLFPVSMLPQTPTAVIDGATHPELIPDSVAYRFVLMSLSLPPHPTKVDLAKHVHRVGRMGLGSSDAASLDALLGKFSTSYADWEASIALKDSAAAVFDRNELINNSLLEIESMFSPEGFVRFRRYVQGEKAKMTMPKS